MKKVSFIFIVIIAGISLIVALNIVKNAHREPSIEVESTEEIRYKKFESTLKNSTRFKDSEFVSNETKDTLTLDDKYIISIKNNHYAMTIKDAELENDYCHIVDAIEVGLGHKSGDSIQTCLKTLEGAIDVKGISAEIYDDYKILMVNSEEPIALYDISTTHTSAELISTDEIDYNIEIDDFLITSVAPKYDEVGKTYSVCGNIFNKTGKENDTFTFSLYESSKEKLLEANYLYENSTKKYISFCVEFPLEHDNVKYFSIERS